MKIMGLKLPVSYKYGPAAHNCEPSPPPLWFGWGVIENERISIEIKRTLIEIQRISNKNKRISIKIESISRAAPGSGAPAPEPGGSPWAHPPPIVMVPYHSGRGVVAAIYNLGSYSTSGF